MGIYYCLSAGMLARAEFLSGFGHVFLKCSFSFLIDPSVFILASVAMGTSLLAFLFIAFLFSSIFSAYEGCW